MQNRRRTIPTANGSISRAGLTLYEVVLAFAIFLMSMAAISRILSLGSRAAIQSQLRSEAALLAEGKMAEVVAGAQPMTPTAGELFSADDPSWQWDLEITDVSRVSASGLKEVVVIVRHVTSDDTENATFTIKRYVRDPMIFIEAANETADAAAQSAESESNSSSTGGM